MTAAPASQRLNVCVAAKMTYPARVRDQQQDMATYRALSPWVGRVYLIVTSAGETTHVSHDGPAIGIHIPYGRNAALRWLRFLIVGWFAGRRIVRRRRIDVVMAAEPFAGGVLALALGRAAGCPVLAHIQGDLLSLPGAAIGRLRASLMRRMTIAVARRADLVRCISNGVRQSCIEAGLAPERLRVLPIRVDLDRFDAARHSRDAARRHFGVDGGAVLIASAGSLTIHKGYGVLVEAFARVKAALPSARLLIAGEGPERQAIERAIARLRLTDAVALPGWLPYSAVPELLAACDIYAQPSFDEGIPRAALEAMAMARPVVASRVGGLPELVQDGATGLLVPAGDAAALADALMRIARDPALGARLGAAARTASAAYEMGGAIRRYAELLCETAGRQPAAT